MNPPTRRALVIAHEPDGPSCQVGVRLRERGFELDTHVVTSDYAQPDKAVPFPDWSHYDLIVPMGSVRSLTAKDEISSWIHAELDLLGDAHRAGTPVLGVCFGGQLLADALGGSVEAAPVTEIGWFEIEAPAGGNNPVGPGPWFEWHHDRFRPPADAEILAVNDNAVQLFRVEKSVGTQFHPEVDVAHVEGFLAGADNEYLTKWGVDRRVLLAAVADNEERNIKQCHALVDWFLDDIAIQP